RSASREIEVAVAIGVLATIGPREAADVTRWWDAEGDFHAAAGRGPAWRSGNGPVVLPQQSQLAGSGDGLGAVICAELVEDVGDVALDRVQADHQFFGDRLEV